MTAPFLIFSTGAVVLLYQVLWDRTLALVFGQSAAARTLVLAVFIVGVMLGHRLLGSGADRVSKPLSRYGRLSLLLAVYALGFETLVQQLDPLFTRVAAGLVTSPWLSAVRVLGASLILLAPTFLMGGFLPLLAAWLQQRHWDAGRRAAWAYAAGVLGAAVGWAVAEGFILGRMSLHDGLWIAAGVNAFVGLLALLVSRFEKPAQLTPGSSGSVSGGMADGEGSQGVLTVACYLVALAGAVLMALHVLTGRSLALLGGASHTMLWGVSVVCFVGVGLGAAVVASPGWRSLSWGPAALSLVLISAVWTGGVALVMDYWPEGFWRLNTGLVRSDTGYALYRGVGAGIVFLVLGLPAACVGAILPLSVRLLGGQECELGQRVGRLMAWNLFGALVGLWVTARWLMPLLGLRGAFLAVAVVLGFAAAVLALSGGRTVSLVASLILMGGLVWGGFSTGAGWQLMLSTGVYRLRQTTADAEILSQRRGATQLLYYMDAPDGTVSVEATPAQTPFGTNTVLRVNGEPEASSTVDFSRHALTGHLPLLSRPGSTNVFLLGWGGGGVAGAVLRHRVDRLTVAEECPSVLAAARYLNAINDGATGDPRLNVIPEDGRWVLKLSQEAFDVIITEPPPPWLQGADAFFSGEFYALCARRLKADGLLAQWLPAGEMSDEDVLLVLRTFSEAFPYLEIWDMNRRDLLLLGGQVHWPTGTNIFRAGFEREGVRQHLRLVGLSSPATVWTRQLASQRTAWAIAGAGPVLQDALPRLSQAGPRDLFIGASSRVLLDFDERMGREALAPKEKLAVLASLPRPLVERAFDPFDSFQGELSAYILAPETGMPTNGTFRTSIFHPQETLASRDGRGVAPDADDPSGALAEWERVLRSRDGEWAQTAAQVLSWLEAGAGGSAGAVGASDARAAALAEWASMRCLRQGEPALAADLARAGLKRFPDNRSLAYLRRIAEREAPLRGQFQP